MSARYVLTVLTLVCGVSCLSCFGVENTTLAIGKICSGRGKCIATDLCLCDSKERSRYEGKSCQFYAQTSILEWGNNKLPSRTTGDYDDDVMFILETSRIVRYPNRVLLNDADIAGPGL